MLWLELTVGLRLELGLRLVLRDSVQVRVVFRFGCCFLLVNVWCFG